MAGATCWPPLVSCRRPEVEARGCLHRPRRHHWPHDKEPVPRCHDTFLGFRAEPLPGPLILVATTGSAGTHTGAGEEGPPRSLELQRTSVSQGPALASRSPVLWRRTAKAQPEAPDNVERGSWGVAPTPGKWATQGWRPSCRLCWEREEPAEGPPAQAAEC